MNKTKILIYLISLSLLTRGGYSLSKTISEKNRVVNKKRIMTVKYGAKKSDELYSLLSEELMQNIYDMGYRIVLIGNDGILESKYNINNISGRVDHEEKIIYVESLEDYDYSKNVYIHEIGHAFDYSYDLDELTRLSFLKEFLLIYKEEINDFLETSYFLDNTNGVYKNVDDANEYFASAFACYFFKPDELKEYCPKTYDFMKKVLIKM